MEHVQTEGQAHYQNFVRLDVETPGIHLVTSGSIETIDQRRTCLDILIVSSRCIQSIRGRVSNKAATIEVPRVV